MILDKIPDNEGKFYLNVFNIDPSVKMSSLYDFFKPYNISEIFRIVILNSYDLEFSSKEDLFRLALEQEGIINGQKFFVRNSREYTQLRNKIQSRPGNRKYYQNDRQNFKNNRHNQGEHFKPDSQKPHQNKEYVREDHPPTSNYNNFKRYSNNHEFQREQQPQREEYNERPAKNQMQNMEEYHDKNPHRTHQEVRQNKIETENTETRIKSHTFHPGQKNNNNIRHFIQNKGNNETVYIKKDAEEHPKEPDEGKNDMRGKMSVSNSNQKEMTSDTKPKQKNPKEASARQFMDKNDFNKKNSNTPIYKKNMFEALSKK